MPWPIQSIQSTIISKTGMAGTFDPNQPETDKLKLEVLSLAKRWKPGKPRK